MWLFGRTCATLALRNLRQSRAIYLIATLAVTVAAWLIFAAITAAFIGAATSNGAAGITIDNGNHSVGLPLRYAGRIEAIAGTRDVAWYTLQFVNCGQNVQVELVALGGPGSASRVAPPDSHDSIPPAVVHRWLGDPLGALVTRQTLADCGWKVGQGVDPPVAFNRSDIPMHITGISAGGGDAAYVHFDYINRIAPMFGKDNVFRYVVGANNVCDNERVAARIEAAFTNDFPTVSATTNTTVQNAFQRFGKVQELLAFVMAAMLLCAASVLVSVLAFVAIQRRQMFAILQVMGFGRAVLFGSLVLEVLMVAVIGVLCGVGIGELAVYLEPRSLQSVLFRFVIPDWAFGWVPLWMAALIVIALAWPVRVIAHVRPIDYRDA